MNPHQTFQLSTPEKTLCRFVFFFFSFFFFSVQNYSFFLVEQKFVIVVGGGRLATRNLELLCNDDYTFVVSGKSNKTTESRAIPAIRTPKNNFQVAHIQYTTLRLKLRKNWQSRFTQWKQVLGCVQNDDVSERKIKVVGNFYCVCLCESILSNWR